MPAIEDSPIHFVSPQARQAFEVLLAPVRGLVTSESQAMEVKDHLLSLLSEARLNRNALYHMLIRHKPLSSADEVFFGDLEYAAQEWALTWAGR